MGGAYLDRPDIYDLGVKVSDACHYEYNTTLTGLGPSCKRDLTVLLLCSHY